MAMSISFNSRIRPPQIKLMVRKMCEKRFKDDILSNINSASDRSWPKFDKWRRCWQPWSSPET